MRYSKQILTVALAAMLPGAALNAQTYNDTVRNNTWSVYGYGGISTHHGLRSETKTDIRSVYAPSFALGVKYNIKPWIRVGLEAGYTLLKSKNESTFRTEATKTDYVGSNKNQYTQTTEEMAVLIDNHDQHVVSGDLNVDINLLRLFKADGKFNIWLGTGVGYLWGWDRGTQTVMSSSNVLDKTTESVDKWTATYGIETPGRDTNTHGLFIPGRISFEYDICPLWTIGARAEYKYLPLDNELTPKGICNAGLSLAYNFVGKYYGKRAVAARHQADLDRLNTEINGLRKANNDLDGEKARLTVELAKTIDALNAANKSLEQARNRFKDPILYPVFFQLDKTVITPQQKPNVAAAADLMKKYPNAKLVIKGYASTEGPLDHNQDLSVNRAAAVTKMLVEEYGISADRITSEGCGVTADLFEVFELNRVSMLYVGTE